jgi:hypothetical protein
LAAAEVKAIELVRDRDETLPRRSSAPKWFEDIFFIPIARGGQHLLGHLPFAAGKAVIKARLFEPAPETDVRDLGSRTFHLKQR